MIELTHNWDPQTYQHGTGYGHLALAVEDIHEACERFLNLGAAVLRAPGPMRYGTDDAGHKETIAFIEDPDGYRIDLIESKPAEVGESGHCTSLSAINLPNISGY